MPKPTFEPKKRAEFTQDDKYYNIRMDPKVQRQWVDALLAELESNLSKFNPFEVSFTRSMDQWLKDRKPLTEPQANRLEQIYASKTN